MCALIARAANQPGPPFVKMYLCLGNLRAIEENHQYICMCITFVDWRRQGGKVYKKLIQIKYNIFISLLKCFFNKRKPCIHNTRYTNQYLFGAKSIVKKMEYNKNGKTKEKTHIWTE